MNWEAEASKALKRIEELEKKVRSLEQRMDNQFDATQDLISRVSKLERESKALNAGTF
jgi:phage shock protein A